MFPFIQCHQTRGRALAGGFSNPAFSESDFTPRGRTSPNWPGEMAVSDSSKMNAKVAERGMLRDDRSWWDIFSSRMVIIESGVNLSADTCAFKGVFGAKK
jgi:hypothetical protein